MDDLGVREVWRKHFEKLMNEEFVWDKNCLQNGVPVSGPAEEISVAEVKSAIADTKQGKAAGPSGVISEMLKASGDEGAQWVTDLCNLIVREGRIPDDWRKSWMVNVYKGKGDALDCGSYRGIKLLDHVMKVFERVVEKRVRSKVVLDEMQFGFRPGVGTTDAIFIVRQVQEKYISKKKDLWIAFVDLEKAFDRVPREVVWWALRLLGVEEWLVSVIMAMYEDVKTSVKVKGGESAAFEVKVGVHQGSVLSPLLFTMVLEALSREFRGGLPWELLYADDLALMAESEDELRQQIKMWKGGMEEKGLRVNMGKTKVMRIQAEQEQMVKPVKWPCGICKKSAATGSIQCLKCVRWFHKKCGGIKGNLKDMEGLYVCDECSEGGQTRVVGGTNKSELESKLDDRKKEFDLEMDGKLEYVNKFCYLGDMISAKGGAEDAARTRVRCAWGKFKELSTILTSRGVSLKLKGKIFKTCVQTVMLYASETWAVKAEDMSKLERTQNAMVRWMCGVTLKDRKSTEELQNRLGVEGMADMMRRGRLRWFGHVERKDKEDWVSKCRSFEIGGVRGKGRGRKTWNECVKDDMRKVGLRAVDAQDRAGWRRRVWETSNPCMHGKK